METAAEGLATQVGYELTQEILRDFLSDFVLVSEQEMTDAILLIMEVVRNMAEEAGAASLAAALKIKEHLKGKNVAVILTGGNVSMDRLRHLL
jgi:threonine dehydratase